MNGKRKIVTLVGALFLLAIGFTLFDMLRVSVLSVYNVHWKLTITTTIQTDFYGAVIPTVISLFIILYLVYFRKFSFKRYLRYFLLSIALALLFFRPSGTAIVGYYIFFVISTSFLCAFIAFYNGKLRELIKFRNWGKLDFTLGNFVNALMITGSYAPLSVLIVDLLYAPFADSMYIGAMGLADGIILSMLCTPLTVTFATLFVVFIYEMKYPPQKSNDTTLSDTH